jgi:hypothetical protein
MTLSETIEKKQQSIRIDGLGCRWNPYLDYDPDEKPNNATRLLIGGSAVFGVGASTDAFTIAARMTKVDGLSTYAIGERGLGSWEEIHGYLARFTLLSPTEFILLSGHNDAFWASRYLTVPSSLFRNQFLSGVVNSPFLAQYSLGFASMGTSRLRRIAATLFSGITKLDLLREAMLVREPIRRWFSMKSDFGLTVHNDEELLDQLRASLIATLAVWAGLARLKNAKFKLFLQPSCTWIAALSGSESTTFKGTTTQKHFFVKAYKIISETMEQCAKSDGFEFSDLNQRYAAMRDWRDHFVDECHLNDYGQEELANLLVHT